MPKYPRWPMVLLLSASIGFLNAGCTKEIRKSRHLAKANQAFAAQRYDEAEIEYLKVLQAAPLDPVAFRQLGTIYQEQGKWPRAFAYLKKAVELSPDDVQAHLQLSLAYFSLQNRKLAAQEAAWVLGKQPGLEEALAILADCATNPKDVQDAQAQIEKLRQQDKDRAAYHVALGTLYLKQLNLTNAQVEIKKALSLDPQSAAANMAQGNLYSFSNNLPEADKAFKLAADLSPMRSARRLKYAEFKLGTRAVDAAKQILQDLTQKAPDYLPAWNLLAQVDLAERRLDECDNCLQRVMARDPVNYDALLLVGNLLLVKGDTAKAVAQFEHMASLYDRSPQVLFQLARAYLFNGDTGKAVSKLNSAIATDPNFADAILLLANINLRKSETGAAVAALKDLLGKQPQLPQTYLLLANAYLAQKDPDQAVAVCRQMETRFPKSPEVSLVLGSVYAKEKHPEQARQAFERSLELSPNYLPAVEQIVDLDIADKKYDAALDRVNRQIQRQAGAAEPWLLLAKVHMAKAQSYVATGGPAQEPAKPKEDLGNVPAAQPDVNQAEKALLKSIELNPGLRNSYFMLASLYVACNKQKEALDQLSEFLSKTNDVVGWMQVGIIHDRLKEYPAARDAYNKVLAINPNFSLALNNLAYLYSEHFGDLDKAYQMAEKARQLLPDDPSAADTLGWILFRRGEYERALGILEESAAKLSNDPEIQYHLGMAHYMLVEEEPARQALELAVQSSKDFAAKEEARRRMKVLSIDPRTANASAISDLKRYLHDTPADPVALCRLGAVQQRDGSIDGAIESYDAALKCSPQNPRLMLRLAQLYSSGSSADNKKALELAKQAHSLAPDDPRVSEVLGRLVLAAGDSKWSASLLEASDRQLPGDPEISYDLAWAYYSLGRMSDALTAMAKAQGPGAASRTQEAQRFTRFVSAARDGSVDALSAEADQALKTDAAYVPALAVSALGQERQGHFQEAARLYERILAVYPLFSPATRNLAILYAQRLGEDTKAYAPAVRAREVYPQDPQVAKVLGILEYRKANYRRSAQLLGESSQKIKDDAELFYYLGMAQYQLKAAPESKAALEHALALNIQPKLADDAKRILLELK